MNAGEQFISNCKISIQQFESVSRKHVAIEMDEPPEKSGEKANWVARSNGASREFVGSRGDRIYVRCTKRLRSSVRQAMSQ